MLNLRWILVCGVASAALMGCKTDANVADVAVRSPAVSVTAGTTISGKLVAADGKTPISGGLVYVEGASAQQAAALSCGVPPQKDWVSTCSSTDGSFSLNVQAPLPSAANLVMVKGDVRLVQVFAAESRGVIDAGDVVLSTEAATTSVQRVADSNPG